MDCCFYLLQGPFYQQGDRSTHKAAMIDKIRKRHQDIMGILQDIIDFACPQLLLEFTTLFLLCLTTLFFAQEASMRKMWKQAIALGSTSIMAIMVVYVMCCYSQVLKDQVYKSPNTGCSLLGSY